MVLMTNDDSVERMSESCVRSSVPLETTAPNSTISGFSVRFVVSMGALLPGFGCYFCIAYTYIFQYEIIANFTEDDQCPGVHSSVPASQLDALILRIVPKITSASLYRRAFRKAAPKSAAYHHVIYFYTKTMWIELLGLIAVSVIDIKFSFVVHAISYSIWIISFNFNMLFNTILHHFGGIREKSGKVHSYDLLLLLFRSVSF
uniref:7TM_GPCR_Srx domain-containing protein n=1 Tax=Angiostrongylus cantonensis TaxID=6313 RepID=A0A0K0CYN7_ANGCA